LILEETLDDDSMDTSSISIPIWIGDGGGFVRFAHGNPLRRSIELSWLSG
jgi:hypothetical protein